MRNISESKTYLKMEKSNNGASRWFAFSFGVTFVLLYSILLIALCFEIPLESVPKIMDDSRYMVVLDIILLFGIPYGMIPYLNSVDKEKNSELNKKYNYVSIPLNEWTVLPILIVHVLIFVVVFSATFWSFILAICLMFLVSIYRAIARYTKLIPRHG
ncbi:MAG: hypothetical protein NTY12_02515 [Candidatus Falkowbacteria bacterium]|nr:hypothetical protein [Candidatus Falkowbacteria bacterium]